MRDSDKRNHKNTIICSNYAEAFKYLCGYSNYLPLNLLLESILLCLLDKQRADIIVIVVIFF